MTLISVILPVFYGEKYIGKSVESVLKQTFTDFELIIVNDGSTDSTLNILNRFNDSRIIIINQSNQGPGAARNNALKVASGKYIMFLDSDDWYDEKALEVAYFEAEKYNSDLTFFQMVNYDNGRVYGNDWFCLKIFDDSFENRVFKPCETPGSIFDLSVGVCQKIYNHSFLKRINARFPEEIYFEDMPFFYYVFLKADRVSIVKEKLYFRRKHDESITCVVDEKFFDTVRAGQVLMKIFIENDWYDTYKFDLIAYKINGPRFALRDLDEKHKPMMFDLIKKDYTEIKSTPYYKDFLDNLGPVKKKFFTKVLNSKNYKEFSS